MTLAPFRVTPSFKEKVWGSQDLEPWFPRAECRIGEVWFTSDDETGEDGTPLRDLIARYGAELTGRTGAQSFPILTKFLFTSERLSIQVHPGDDYARSHEDSPGKTEMWYVLRAEPGASIALGFRERLTPERFREAVRTGEIVDLLEWVPVRAGDALFGAAGTVHAIGGGLAICEIQQNSDITYRLYDYGRPRELHIEKGAAVSDLGPCPGIVEPQPLPGGGRMLASCPYFATELHFLATAGKLPRTPRAMEILLFVEGSGTLGGRRFQAGETWIVPACAGGLEIVPKFPVTCLKTYVP